MPKSQSFAKNWSRGRTTGVMDGGDSAFSGHRYYHSQQVAHVNNKMTTVYSILTLPNTSDGLTCLKPTSVPGSADGSGSPPHKVARLSTDYDSASASRSKKTSIHNNSVDGPIQIQIIGNCSSSPKCLQFCR